MKTWICLAALVGCSADVPTTLQGKQNAPLTEVSCNIGLGGTASAPCSMGWEWVDSTNTIQSCATACPENGLCYLASGYPGQVTPDGHCFSAQFNDPTAPAPNPTVCSSPNAWIWLNATGHHSCAQPGAVPGQQCWQVITGTCVIGNVPDGG
jgi:hypothetical protein